MEEQPENIAELPELDTSSAVKSAKRFRDSDGRSVGRPITKETAKQYQLSSARAKALRKQARAKMLAAMCTDLDLGKELVDAIKKNDMTKISIVDKALTIVGLQHNQSSEAIAQKIQVDAKTDTKLTLPNLNITFVDAEPKK